MNQTPQQEKVAATNACGARCCIRSTTVFRCTVDISFRNDGDESVLCPLKVRPRKAPVLLERLQVRPLQQRPAIPAQQIRRLISQRIIRSLTKELNSILRPLNKTFLSRLRVLGLQNK